MVIMIVKYVKPIEEVDKYLLEHRAFLDEYYKRKKFICSGRQKPPVGGVILANVDSVEEAKLIATEDPFCINLVAEYEFLEFTPVKHDERFACFLNPQGVV